MPHQNTKRPLRNLVQVPYTEKHSQELKSSSEIGKSAEDFVAQRLSANGFKILARNHHIFDVEIDILCRRSSERNSIYIVEVKTDSFLDRTDRIKGAQVKRLLGTAFKMEQSLAYRQVVVKCMIAFVGRNHKIDYITLDPWQRSRLSPNL